MPTAKKKAVAAAPKKAAAPVKQSDVVEVRNISGHTINTSKGAIAVNKEGKCTVAELRQYNKYLVKA